MCVYAHTHLMLCISVRALCIPLADKLTGQFVQLGCLGEDVSRSAQGLNGVGKPWFKSYPVLCRMLEGSVAAAGM